VQVERGGDAMFRAGLPLQLQELVEVLRLADDGGTGVGGAEQVCGDYV
jgi:hypothetical protein